jgi:hypothetical protein
MRMELDDYPNESGNLSLISLWIFTSWARRVVMVAMTVNLSSIPSSKLLLLNNSFLICRFISLDSFSNSANDLIIFSRE